MMAIPKYAVLEIERRWLVRPEALPPLADGWLIEDRYLTGTRMRLRVMTPDDGQPPVYKLCKKYGGDALAEPIVNIYLSPAEHALFNQLPGPTLRKRRRRLADSGSPFGIDLFEGPLAGLVLAECEAPSREAAQLLPDPDWASREVTADPFYGGGHLVTVGADELARRLRREFAGPSGAAGH